MNAQALSLERDDADGHEDERDVSAFVQAGEDGSCVLHLMVEGVHCGGCVRRIERALAEQPGVETARLNLTTRRLTLRWKGSARRGNALARVVDDLGYRTVPFDPDGLAAYDERVQKELLRSLAVAGFAAGNVMLLAVSVWAGDFQGMGTATRDLLHWFEALIALPAIAYAGQPFFRSALGALRSGHTNMDVPISLAVTLAPAISFIETIRGAEHVWFDSAITLLFFLLVGRYLDARARGSARSAAERLLALGAQAITVLAEDGTTRTVRPEQIEVGQVALVATGERIGADGRVRDGRGELDTSAITGETMPQPVAPGDRVFAGTINLGPPLEVVVTATGEGTLLAEIVRLMELAEQKRGRHVALADRVARAYAPVVHTLAAATFLGWWLLAGAPWQTAMLYGIAVLIITCPCALGLAVPAVQVIASGRLMKRGALLKSATALERFAEVDTIVFDKTGTLTTGDLALVDRPGDEAALALAAGMALSSRHPLSRALARAVPEAKKLRGVTEHPGQGLELRREDGGIVRLGRREWALEGRADAPSGDDAPAGPELWLAMPEAAPLRFGFADRARPDAASVIAALKDKGYRIELLSGDRPATVAAMAEELGIERFAGGCSPTDKTDRLTALAAAGHKVLMVGDGLNDAPALSAAHASLSPANAVDISQTAADAVFQGRELHAVTDVLATARGAARLVRQNLGLSLAYNVLTVPLAVLGFVTPLVAAICMSASSLLVVLNAARLDRGGSGAIRRQTRGQPA